MSRESGAGTTCARRTASAVCCVCVLLSLPFLKRPPTQKSATTVDWINAALQGTRDSKLAVPVSARSLAIVSTCMYDAWAAYDATAIGTQLSGALRRPLAERTLENKQRALSYAAYRALSDVLPVDTESVYKPLMRQLGYDSGFQGLYLQTLSPNDHSTDIETATGIGNVACAAVLEFRHHDKSNQLGDMPSNAPIGQAQGPYADWTRFTPANHPLPVPIRGPIPAPSTVLDPSHWQPLTYVDSRGNYVMQIWRSIGKSPGGWIRRSRTTRKRQLRQRGGADVQP